MIEILKPMARSMRYGIRKHLLGNANAFDEWFHDGGDDTLILDHPLDETSVVIEVGGYQGKWSSKIINRYNPNLHIFEPVQEFYSNLQNRFKVYSKVKLYHCGLSDRDEFIEFGLTADGSGRFASRQRCETIQLKDIHTFFLQHAITRVDLIQINIEGGEYKLLERMLDTKLTEQCRIIQVQFHRNVPNAEASRADIRDRLSRTHDSVYNYPFVWEAWRRKMQTRSGEIH